MADITGIKDLNKVKEATKAYRDALVNSWRGQSSASDFNYAMKGSGTYAPLKYYDGAVRDKMRKVVHTLDEFISNLDTVHANYKKADQDAGNILQGRINQLKS